MPEDLRKVPNRQTLKRLDSGIEITRAIKHEPIDFASLSQPNLQKLTDDRHGSKFLAEWTLERLVQWIEDQVQQRAWTFPPGAKERARVRLDQPVGYVRGRLVYTITLTVSGRWVHAYPDEDQL